MKIVKRNGVEVEFNKEKITRAILKANKEVAEKDPSLATSDEVISAISNRLYDRCRKRSRATPVEEIQDMVETELMKEDAYEVAKAYIKYRYMKSIARDKYNEMMDAVSEKIQAKNVQNQNANIDEKSFGGRIGEMASMIMKQYALDYCMSETAKNNHINNRIYTHDLDHYPTGDHNCLSMPLDDLLKNGFKTRQTDVRPAGSLSTAFQLVAVLFQLQSLQQFGGVSATHLDWTMVPYVRKSFYKHFKDGLKYIENTDLNPEEEITAESSIEDKRYKKHSGAYKYACDMTERECHQACEGMYHNLKN